MTGRLKKWFAVFLAGGMVFAQAVTALGGEGAGGVLPEGGGIDYLALVNKLHPLPDGWEEALETVHVTNSVGDDVEVEKKAYEAYVGLKEDLLENDGIEIEWRGQGIDEKGYDRKTGKMVVCVNEQWYRPTDVVNLWGDPTKARTKLGWNPQKTSYEELCAIMAEHDLQLAKAEAAQA